MTTYVRLGPHFFAVVVARAAEEGRRGEAKVQGLADVAVGIEVPAGDLDGSELRSVTLSGAGLADAVEEGHGAVLGQALHVGGEGGLRGVARDGGLGRVFRSVVGAAFAQFGAARAGGSAGAALFWGLHLGDGGQRGYRGHRGQRGAACGQLVQVEAGVHARVHVDGHLQAPLHRTVGKLHHEVGAADGTALHLETLLLRHPLQQRLAARSFGVHERPHHGPKHLDKG